MRNQAPRTARAEVKLKILSDKFDQKSNYQEKKVWLIYTRLKKAWHWTKQTKESVSGSCSCETRCFDPTKTKNSFWIGSDSSQHFNTSTEKQGSWDRSKIIKWPFTKHLSVLHKTNKHKNLLTTIQQHYNVKTGN